MLKTDLIPVICQEECAEVIQAISKVYRFGLVRTYEGSKTNKAQLEEEIGQLLFSIEQLVDTWELDNDEIAAGYYNKKETHSNWEQYFPE